MPSSSGLVSSRLLTFESDNEDHTSMRESVVAENHGFAHPVPLGAGTAFPRFSGREITEECLARVMEAGLAPSGWNIHPWRWIVVREAAARKFLEAATSTRAPLSSAPVILISLADTLAWKSAPQHLEEAIATRKISVEEGREALRRVREYYSSSPDTAKRAALANAFFAAHQVLWQAAAFDLSAYWVAEFDENKVKTYFHVPDHFLVATILPIGYPEPTEAPQAPKTALRTPVYKEKFGEVLGLTSPPR